MARFTGASGSGSGLPGPRGPEGDSAYEVAVANGFVGTEQEWLDSLGGGGVDAHGLFVFDNSTLSVDNETTYIKATDGGDDSVEFMMNPYDGIAKISAKSGSQTPRFYASNPDWESATWTTIGEGQGQISFVNAPGIVNILSGELNTASNVGIYVNNMTIGSWNGASFNGFDVNIFVYGPNAENTTEASVDVFGFNYSFESKIEINNNESSMDITATDLTINIRATQDRDINIIASDDATLRAEGDDLFLQAADDIRFTANYSDGEGEHFWRMDSEGEFHLPGNGLIWNPSNSSGDGYGADTIHLVPNDTDNETEQRIIIDPTQPNHIHIRAGGAQDYSSADLILGGERAGVKVSDTDGTTVVRSKQEDYIWTYQNVGEGGNVYVIASEMAEPDYGDFTIISGQKFVISNVTRDQQNGTTSYETTPGIGFIPFENYTFIRDRGNHVWNFNRAGYLNGPTETGHLRVTGIINDDGNLDVQADQNLILSGGESNGEYLHDSSNPNNQIATIGDISSATPVETSFTVNGGTLGTQPTFDGAPLFSGSYVKTGPMVHFQVQVDMNNILTFGTGQYYVDLPFDSKYGYQFAAGCLHDVSTGKQYAIGGHVYAGQSQLLLSFTNSNGQDEPFDHNSPVTLTSEDNFHISGTYITD